MHSWFKGVKLLFVLIVLRCIFMCYGCWSCSPGTEHEGKQVLLLIQKHDKHILTLLGFSKQPSHLNLKGDRWWRQGWGTGGDEMLWWRRRRRGEGRRDRPRRKMAAELSEAAAWRKAETGRPGRKDNYPQPEQPSVERKWRLNTPGYEKCTTQTPGPQQQFNRNAWHREQRWANQQTEWKRTMVEACRSLLTL